MMISVVWPGLTCTKFQCQILTNYPHLQVSVAAKPLGALLFRYRLVGR